MERRSFVKSLLPLAALFSFKGFQTANELYKGKRLVVADPDHLKAICEKMYNADGTVVPVTVNRYVLWVKGGPAMLVPFLPRFNSEKGIMDDMRSFVDMSEGHLEELGDEVYGCINADGTHSVCSFAPPSGHHQTLYSLLRGRVA